METEHGVLLNCNNKEKDRRGKIQCEQGRDVFNTMTWEKKRAVESNPVRQ